MSLEGVELGITMAMTPLITGKMSFFLELCEEGEVVFNWHSW